MGWHVKHEESTGLTEILNPGNSDAQGLEFALLRLAAGASIDTAADGRESLVTILGGRASIAVEGGESWQGLGDRDNVFSGLPTSVYVPTGARVRVQADGAFEAAIWRARAASGGQAYVIRPSAVAVAVRGEGPFRRRVHTILDASRSAQHLIVGETFNEPGAWSSYPPHKHERHDPPREGRFEEIYHFRLDPHQGFGIQRIYSPERQLDELYTVEDGDTVLIPFGYHPVVAAPGYRLCYLWALSGEGRTLMAKEDPQHSWTTRPR